MAFNRFVSRRGRPETIYSDNGKNFIGAANLLGNLNFRKIVKKANNMKKIFNPPSAAWWGGWWERLIRIMKDLLRRTLGNRRLDGVQLETCLCEVEATMNKRPLTYVTEDSADLIPLTPQMFMTDQSDTNFPRVENLDSDELRRRYKTLGNLKEELRSRFRKEYLAELVHKGKSKDVQEFRVGDVILVGDDNMKRQDWPIARIVELLPGADGHCRLARVKSLKGFFMRPLQKLFRLEVGSADSIPKPKPPKDMQDVIYNPVERTRCGRKVKKPKDY